MSASISRPETLGRRRQKTRDALLRAGQTLFAAGPVEAVTIDHIVAEADIAKGSFYNYFDDKQGLVQAVTDAAAVAIEAHIAAWNSGTLDPPARVVGALCAVLIYARQHPERLQALLSLSERKTVADVPMNSGMVADITAGLAANRFRHVTVETGILTVMGMVVTTLRHALISGTPTPQAELASAMGAAMLRALGMCNDESKQLAQTAANKYLGEAT
jgi:AcrR family transcriptional regulator